MSMLHYRVNIPSDAADGQVVVVLLHGRGSDENDMFGLVDYFPDVIFMAVRAPNSGQDWGYGGGYAWYQYLGGTTPDPEHFESSQQQIHEFLSSLPDLLPVVPGPLILGGFSQGGTTSLGYALRHAGAVHTCMNLSGFLPTHPGVIVSPESVAETRFYWPHGLMDMAVPHEYAVTGRAQLRAAGADLIGPDYGIGHQLIMDEIEEMQDLIASAQQSI